MRALTFTFGTGLVVLVAAVSAADGVSSERTPFTAAATQPCLLRIPAALAGLPPAEPPTAAPFVYRAKPDRVIRPAVATLYAFKGAGAGWEEVSLSFFRNERSARGYATSLLDRHRIVRNVIVDSATPSAPWEHEIVACLRDGVPRPAPGSRAAPRVSLATFAGRWGGHTRGLRISPAGRGSEYADSGCCIRAYDLSFRILRISGTVTRATATYRVTGFRRNTAFSRPVMRVGQVGRLSLRDGVMTNRASDDFFCSDPAWDATGVCGL